MLTKRAAATTAARREIELRALRVGEIRRDDLVPRAAKPELHQPHNLREGDADGLGLVLGLILALELQCRVLREDGGVMSGVMADAMADAMGDAMGV